MDQILFPLHLACLDDDMRPNLRLIHIHHGIAHATNAHILVKLSLKDTSTLTDDQIKILEDKYIDMEVWKEIHKCDQLELDDEYLICHKDGIKKIFEYSSAMGSFFSLDSIIEEIKRAEPLEKSINKYNAKYIEIIRKIFGDNELTFATSSNNTTLVYPYDGCGFFAVLMPVYTAESNRYFFTT